MQNFRLKYAKIAYNYKRIIKEIIKEFLLTTYYYGAYARKEKVSRFLFLLISPRGIQTAQRKTPSALKLWKGSVLTFLLACVKIYSENILTPKSQVFRFRSQP